MNEYNATFHKYGWFGVSIDTEDFYAIIKTKNELNTHIKNIISELNNNMAFTPDEYLKEQEKEIKSFYASYDAKFFKEKILVIALIDRGSGSYRHELTSLTTTGDTLIVTVKRKVGMIMTMDYVPWVSTLELSKQYSNVNQVSVVLNT